MASFFTETNRVAAVFGEDFAVRRIRQEFEMTIPLDPQVPFGDIVDKVCRDDTAALWLDRDCIIVDTGHFITRHHYRYQIIVNPMSGSYHRFSLYQVPGTTEHRAPLPALEYFLTRLANDNSLRSFKIYGSYDEFNTLDVSPVCFSHLLQTSRLHTYDDERIGSVQLNRMSLTAEQTALLFTHDRSSIFIQLDYCSFHGPTLLRQLETAEFRREQNHALGQGSYLAIELGDEGIISISCAELTALLSNPHLRRFNPLSLVDDGEARMSSTVVKKFVAALAANEISRFERLYLSKYDAEFEWKKEEEPSAWIDFWKAIEKHPSLKEIRLGAQKRLCQQSWWHPIAAAAEVNPRLVHVDVTGYSNRDCTWRKTLVQHVEPLLERNRYMWEISQYRPKIAALCRTEDQSKAAALLAQAIVAIARKKNMHSRCKRGIHRMLLEQLLLTGYDFGVGVGQVLGKKRSLADTAVVVPNEADAIKTEARVADGIAASTNDNDKESNL